MRNSVIYAHRRGESVQEIAHKLGFSESCIKKVITPVSTTKITTAVVSVRKLEKKLVVAATMAATMTEEFDKKQRQKEAGKKSWETRRKKGIKITIDPNMKSYEKEPFFVEKTKRAKVFLNQNPLPKELVPTQMDRIENVLKEILTCLKTPVNGNKTPNKA